MSAELLQMALNALEYHQEQTRPISRTTDAINTLRSALADPLEPVEGDLLPAIRSKVLIHLGRQDAWVEHTVVGYYVWGAMSFQVQGDPKTSDAYRVFVRVRDDQGFFNARLLSDVRPVAAAPKESTV